MSDALRATLPNDPDARWEAIARYVADESDPREADAVEAWLASHPEDAALAAIVKARADRAETRAAVTVDTERALAGVRARLATGTPAHAPNLRLEKGGAPGSEVRAAAAPARRWRTIGLAAAAGLAAVIGVSQWQGPAGSAVQEYRTAVGQRDSVRLVDGTTVVLAPGSHLTVAANYGAGPRDVTLEGAAYFEVEHDAAHPFTVHTATAAIRDIGTAFTVKATGAGVSVAVTHGIVAIEPTASATTPAELRAGDRGTLASGTLRVERGVVTEDAVAWTRGPLTYRDASLQEVADDLRRWYGIELQVTDRTLASRTLTATLRGETASQVVQTVALALGAEVVQRGDTVLLQPQGSGSPKP